MAPTTTPCRPGAGQHEYPEVPVRILTTGADSVEERVVLGWLVAPGLTVHVSHDGGSGTALEHLYDLTHVRGGRMAASRLCARHIDQAAAAMIATGVDWDSEPDELDRDPRSEELRDDWASRRRCGGRDCSRERFPHPDHQSILQALALTEFNRRHPIGVPVWYWTGLRAGPGRETVTLGEAYLCDGTAVVPLLGWGCPLPLALVEPVTVYGRVALGAAWLDEHQPGWASRLDLDALDLGSQRLDVLGQLYGRCLDAPIDLTELALLGFDVASRADVTPQASRYELDTLTRAWRNLAVCRRQRIGSARGGRPRPAARR